MKHVENGVLGANGIVLSQGGLFTTDKVPTFLPSLRYLWSSGQGQGHPTLHPVESGVLW